MEINGREVWIQLPGRFNASNLLAVYAAAILLGHHQEDVLQALSKLEPVRGRFEVYRSDQGRLAIVDYAHSPDALRSVLETIREIHPGEGEIITVVGAGGGRDQGKRPQMARIAAETSHKVILTSDNPRSEDPMMILKDIESGMEWSGGRNYEIEPDRRKAIARALILAKPGDVVLVAGKGHEDYQILKDEVIHFSDSEVITEILSRQGQGGS